MKGDKVRGEQEWPGTDGPVNSGQVPVTPSPPHLVTLSSSEEDAMPPRGRSDPGQGSGPSRYPGTFHLAFQEATAGLGWEVLRWRGDVVMCREADGREHVV